MEVKFNVTKEERKALIKAIAEITGRKAAYLGAPSFAFTIGDYTVDRYGALICDELVDAEDVRSLLMGLAERGFVFEGDTHEIAPAVSSQNDAVSGESGNGDVDEVGDHSGGDSAEVEDENEPDGALESGDTVEADDGRLSISMPLFGFTASSLDNLERLIASKAWIIRKMAGTDELLIERDEKHLRFPWFKQDASATEIDAYSRLIAGLCETAKTKQRVVATERPLSDGDNEKYKARCFLLSLGFIGKDSAQARKILLAPMSGNGSHKSGDHKKQGALTGATAAKSGAENLEAIHARRDDSGVDGAQDRLFCQERQEYVAENGYCDEFHC
jgi:hypothetical protein